MTGLKIKNDRLLAPPFARRSLSGCCADRLVRVPWELAAFHSVFFEVCWSSVMTVHAVHQGIQYELEEIGEDEWRWTFHPPVGGRRTEKVVGEAEWAIVVVQRAIETWHEINGAERPEAA